MKKILFLLISLTCLNAKNYYLSDFIKLESILKEVKAGDTIIIKDGIYKNIDIIFKANGKLDKTIKLKAEHPYKVIISGKSSMSILGDYLEVEGIVFKNGYPSKSNLITIGSKKIISNNCILNKIKVINFNSKKSSDKYSWVTLYGGHHNIVKNSLFTCMKNRGVTLKVILLKNAKPNYHIIKNNIFSFREKGKKNGYEIIRIGTSKTSLQSSKTVVENNYFYKCNGELEIISNKSCDNQYSFNTFEDSDGMLTLRHGNNCIVKNNIFLNKTATMGGIRVVGNGHKIINNTFYNIGSTPLKAAISFMNGAKKAKKWDYTQVKDCLIENNNFYNTKYTISFGTNRTFKNGENYILFPKNIKFIKNKFYNCQYFLYNPIKNNKNIKFIENEFYNCK